jgi:hypothetical protein
MIWITLPDGTIVQSEEANRLTICPECGHENRVEEAMIMPPTTGIFCAECGEIYQVHPHR